MKIEHVEQISAPIDRVWALTMDVEALPTITPTMTSVERLDDGPLDVGSKATIKQPGQRARVWTVSELQPNETFAWSTKLLGVTMTGAHHLEEAGDGTQNTLTVDIEGPLAPLVGPLMKRPIAKAIATENEGFRDAAERS